MALSVQLFVVIFERPLLVLRFGPDLQLSLQAEQVISVPGDERRTLVGEVDAFERTSWTCRQESGQ